MLLAEVTPARLEDYVAQRLAEPGIKRGSTTAARTVRAELHCLSHAMRRAVVLGHVAANPVRLMMSKPALPAAEAAFLTDAEAARLLEAAREEDAATATLVLERRDRARARARERPEVRGDGAIGHAPGASARAPGDGWHAPSMEDQVPFAHAVVATYLYTGGRADEVLGLLVGDVDVARALVHLRHNRWRRLKREHHQRSVQLWPALAEVLGPHLDYLATLGPGALEPEALLFPSPKTGRPLDRFGKPLDRVLRRAGLVPPATPRVTPHTLRHTYASALLQTLVPTADGGWAVRSSFDVAKQLGHRSSKLVDDTYGHAVADPVYHRELRYGGIAPTAHRADDTAGGSAPATDAGAFAAGVEAHRPARGRAGAAGPHRPPRLPAPRQAFPQAAVLDARPDDVLQIVPSRQPHDCGTSALAMLLRLPYEPVAAALAAAGAPPHASAAGPRHAGVPGGTTEDQLVAAAARLGYRLRRHAAGTFDPRRCSGVLGIDFDRPGHWLFACGGTAYDADGRVWAVGEYFAAHGAVAVLALTCDVR